MSSSTFRVVVVVAILAAMAVSCRGAARNAVPVVRASDGRAVQRANIVAFDTGKAAIAGIDGSPAPYVAQMTSALVDALGAAGITAAVTPAAMPGQGAIVVEGDVVVLDGGSRAQRYLSGMWTGDGAAVLEVRGRVLNPDGSVAGEFRSRDTGQFGSFGGNSHDLLMACAEVVGADIADMVVTGQYRTLAVE